MSLLDELRQKATIITGAQEQDLERSLRAAECVDAALRQGFSFFLEAVNYLNVINPENKRHYVIPGLGNFEGMRNTKFTSDFRTTMVLDKRRIEHFYVRYTSSADRVIEKELEFVAAEKLLWFLEDSNLEYEKEDILNEKGKISRRRFRVPCALRPQLIFRGDYPGRLIHVSCRNVERFGESVFTHDAEAFDVGPLESYVKFIIGNETRVRHGRVQAR